MHRFLLYRKLVTNMINKQCNAKKLKIPDKLSVMVSSQEIPSNLNIITKEILNVQISDIT